MPFQVVLYGKPSERPSRAALQSLLDTLEDPVEDLVRKDARFRELSLNAVDYVDDADAVLDLLVEHIELLQRPVIVRGDKAIIGRPKERVPKFLCS